MKKLFPLHAFVLILLTILTSCVSQEKEPVEQPKKRCLLNMFNPHSCPKGTFFTYEIDQDGCQHFLCAPIK